MGWGDILKLPDAAPEELAGLLNDVETWGAWPKELLGAIVVMLPKGEGGKPLAQRPIGLLPGIYRLWARIRVTDLKEVLEARRGHSEMGGKPGIGAGEVALLAALETEGARGAGCQAATGFVDVSKCYETVDLEEAHRAVIREGWPEVVADLVFQQYGAGRRVKVAGATSQETKATRGIVAGCGFAIYALAAYMRPAIQEVQREVPEASIRTYVDDVRMDVIVHGGGNQYIVHIRYA